MLKRPVRERPAAKEKVQSFLAIACDKDVVRQLLAFQCVQRKIPVVLIVFHQQYVEIH
jgi:hypothetical protein